MKVRSVHKSLEYKAAHKDAVREGQVKTYRSKRGNNSFPLRRVRKGPVGCRIWPGLERWEDFGKSKTQNMSVKKSIIDTHSSCDVHIYIHAHSKINQNSFLKKNDREYSGPVSQWYKLIPMVSIVTKGINR